MNKRQKKVAVGVGVTALAAAAAGTYLLAGKHGAKNRAKVSKWAGRAKSDIMKQLKGVKAVTKKSYTDAVDTVLKRYKTLKKVQPAELVALANELKGHWDGMTSEVSKVARKVVPAKKVAAKKTKKSVAKPAKKSAAKKGKK